MDIAHAVDVSDKWGEEMSDLIRREDAIKAAEDGMCTFYDCDVLDRLNAVPSADRPQGDFVSKRYLLAEIDDLADEFSEVDENGLHSERWCGILDSRGIIVNAPSVSDRPQGEWKHLKGDEWLCSECGYVIWTEGSWEHPLERGKDYCEHCGARMKGADDE